MGNQVAIYGLEAAAKTLQDAAMATGNGTVFDLNGQYASLALQITGTFVATVTFEASVDGTNYVAIRGTNKNTGVSATSAAAAGIFVFDITGVKKFRARVSAYTSGSVTATATATAESVSPLDDSTTGTYTTPAHTAVSVETASTAVLAANSSRKYLLMVNDSDTVIYLALGDTAALNAGIRLNANGGSYEMSRELGNLYTGAVNAITSVAGKNLIVTEGT